RIELKVPKWVGPASVRRGVHAEAGALDLVSVEGMARPHPYLLPSGEGFPDNDERFLRFSAAVAALTERDAPDVLHLNDWHTATALAALESPPPSVLSIHNLVYQGITAPAWLTKIGPRAKAFERQKECNPLAGGIALADRIVVVSPTYAKEVRTPAGGAGLDALLTSRAGQLVGILNGIDTTVWDPAHDRALVRTYGARTLWRKEANREALRKDLGLRLRPDVPLFVVLSRLAHQKGIDLLVPLLRFFPALPAQLAVLGAGERDVASGLKDAVARSRGDIAFVEGYDEGMSHRLLAAGDMLLMPSRFEPCGLTQMQAMRYGTLPVATDVGGLHDTIVDLDQDPERGNGWLAAEPSEVAVLDAIHRAVRGWHRKALRRGAQRRAIATDWSWKRPAREYLELYRRVGSAGPTTLV
ncbi:MAG: glycogen/starch synthase, partial [Myxococcales bacterium]|nr:glycogen/starch synthase [Myxococcales bacterium]